MCAGELTERPSSDIAKLYDFYVRHVEETLLPFWLRAVDPVDGGVHACFNNEGTALISREKYTWTQGRFVWVWSRLAQMCAEGRIRGDAAAFLEQAGKTVQFIRQHAILPSGSCAFLLTSEGGTIKDDTSFFADCYVVLGLCEYATVADDRSVLEDALKLFDSIEARLADGSFRTEPYSIPAGLKAHSVPMIMLHVTNVLSEALQVAEHDRLGDLLRHIGRYGGEIMETFLQPEGHIAEYVPAYTEGTDRELKETLLCRHVNPGHSIECMWFVLEAAQRLGRTDWMATAIQTIKHTFRLGWDNEHGGLLRFVDLEGGAPLGRRIGDPYEQLILDSWETKLWWPHSETLFAALFGSFLTGDGELRELYDRMHGYTFRLFPNPDPAAGEWIQIRDRQGAPVQVLAALPVKDPFHILRDCLLILELLEGKINRRLEGGSSL
jgi:N-acylglucosamine 2-epimerase